MLNAEMDAHIDYDKNSTELKDTSNRRNSYGKKYKYLLVKFCHKRVSRHIKKF